MHNEIRKYIKKRKGAYDKAKKVQNNTHHWVIYKQLRNKTTQLIRNARISHTSKLAERLKNQTI
jgi:hypothetical protein